MIIKNPGLLNSRYFLVAIIYSFGMQEVIQLPYFNHRIQCTEILFILVLIFLLPQASTFFLFLKTLLRQRIPLVFTIGLFTLVFLICILLHVTNASILEGLGKIYVLCFYFIIVYLFQVKEKFDFHIIIKHFTYLGAIMCAFGLIAWIASVNGYPNTQVSIYEEYPYIGTAHRLEGFTATPSMFISIVTCSAVLSFGNYILFNASKKYLWMALFILLISLLCFTKSWIYMPALFASIYLWKKFRSISFSTLPIFLSCFLHFVSTHFIFQPIEKKFDPIFLSSPYTSNQICFENKSLVIFESCYATFKKTAWDIGSANFFTGIGPGNYNAQIDVLKKLKKYPDKLPSYDPHSSLLGSFAECGIWGLLLIILLYTVLLQSGIKMLTIKPNLAIIPFFLSILIIAESISTDVLNFRHYWFVFALVTFMQIMKDQISDEIPFRYNSALS